MNKCFFLTGTDTDVGKTVVGCALLQAAADNGYKTAGYKPVASGGEQLTVGLRNSDAQLLIKNSNVKLNYHDVNPIVFAQTTSPHIASQLTGELIDWQIMHVGLNKLKQYSNWIIVEGAGGWYTPICTEKTLADWVIQQQLPVILVVGVKLGCINHAMLTAQAIEQSGLLFAGWVANEIVLPGKYQQAYLLTLKQRLSAPCLGVIPHLPDWKSHSIGEFVNLDHIL
ncbi:ATP-dependent dethiobiotin synthetase BioD 1 [Arsenophonus endosymbiont of Aleurodicus dispersus]|uniref:dethiobiotin synthase n=1 Tax=Arsenophonus endosymbiont of Aleurodicus dispersus TaxID=235559 RepID=UPI000EAD12C2|nr:dethiobiotin synthase [Arsenophonus endosymbiont of Aleurodicus dispersus]VAY02448.1 ATP-dependent dethiobiotin synthetase BioD 1 [Arsenophonus endosymbiont of Aleurodicus dispersus]